MLRKRWEVRKELIQVGTKLTSRMEIDIVLIGRICKLKRSLKGVLTKNPFVLITGNILVVDEMNKMKANLEFIKDKANGYFSWGKKKEVIVKNKVLAKIFKCDGTNEKLIEEGHGLWTRYLHFGNKMYWRYDDNEGIEFFKEEDLNSCLPSSSILRSEIQIIANEKFADADRLIEKIETVENNDAYNRKKFLKSLKK